MKRDDQRAHEETQHAVEKSAGPAHLMKTGEKARPGTMLEDVREADDQEVDRRKDLYGSFRMNSSTSSPRALANPLSSPEIANPHFSSTRKDATLSFTVRAYMGRALT